MDECYTVLQFREDAAHQSAAVKATVKKLTAEAATYFTKTAKSTAAGTGAAMEVDGDSNT